jgi:hypothetical protein
VRRVILKPQLRGSFFAGRLAVATPLLVALLCLEASDIVFAIDSVPAIFGLTKEPFVVFTSNIFAILGLRSMYFMLGGAVTKFHLLRYGLAVVLVFVGLKMVWLDTWFGGKPIGWPGIIVGPGRLGDPLVDHRRSSGPTGTHGHRKVRRSPTRTREGGTDGQRAGRRSSPLPLRWGAMSAR